MINALYAIVLVSCYNPYESPVTLNDRQLHSH